MKAPHYLRQHPMYSASDYAYLRGKGYTHREIAALWDRDARWGCRPVHHRPVFDLVGYLNQGKPRW